MIISSQVCHFACFGPTTLKVLILTFPGVHCFVTKCMLISHGHFLSNPSFCEDYLCIWVFSIDRIRPKCKLQKASEAFFPLPPSISGWALENFVPHQTACVIQGTSEIVVSLIVFRLHSFCLDEDVFLEWWLVVCKVNVGAKSISSDFSAF